jgi:hypothetical protein
LEREHCFVEPKKQRSVKTTMSADEEDSANKMSGGNNAFEEGMSRASGFLDKAFRSCAADPKGSVHRAWGISLIFVLLYFVMSVIESE